MKKFFLLSLTGIISMTLFAQVEIVGHRGASYLAPENTVASSKLGWELNADGVEIDIYYTADNKVVVSHDKSTKRTSGVDHVIPETKSSVLRKLDVGSWKDPKYAGEKLPFVKEIFKIIPKDKSKYLVVEIKTGPEIFPALQKEIKKSKRLDQMAFIAFNWETILKAKELYPNNPCYWLTSSEKDLANKLPECAAAGLDGVDVHYKLVTREMMDKANALGLDVWVWTVDDPAEARRVRDLGVKSITTNRPGWLREQLEK